MSNKMKGNFIGSPPMAEQTLHMKRQQITVELLDQEEDVFVSQNSVQKGLQQYFTPVVIGEFIKEILPVSSGVVFDPTAGCGNLMLPYLSTRPRRRDDVVALGVELDKSNIPKPTDQMRIVNANFPELFPYLAKVGFEPHRPVLNPPFNLFWKIPELTGTDDKTVESQEATIRMTLKLLEGAAEIGTFIVNKSTWERSLSQKPLAKHVFATVTLQNAFMPESNVECLLGFFETGKWSNKHHAESIGEWDLSSISSKTEAERLARDMRSLMRRKRLYDGGYFGEVDEQQERFMAAYGEYRASKKKHSVYTIDYTGGRLRCSLSNYMRFIIEKELEWRERELFKKIHGVSPSYFAFNSVERRMLFQTLEQHPLITISPRAQKAIIEASEKAEFILTPMYRLKPQQRLGYLEEVDEIQCKRHLEVPLPGQKEPFAFQVGEKYKVDVHSVTTQTNYNKEASSGELKEMVKVGRSLAIRVGDVRFTESAEHIDMLIRHFEIPDPTEVSLKNPALYDKMRQRLKSTDFARFTLREFQIEDLARAGMKDSLVLSWEQGLGKSRGALAWQKLRGARKVLIIAPQDLKAQWIDEGKALGVEIDEISGHLDVPKIRKAKSGVWLIHYELLKGSRRLDILEHGYGDEDDPVLICPNCRATRRDGWTGKSCRVCHHHVWLRRVKPLYVRMKKMFDTVIVDEGVKIKSKHSLQGIAVRSLHARNRLLLSGSPIKGWITDAFWLLHWTLGNASSRFPYHYDGGTEKFLNDFGVWEYLAEEFKKSLSKGRKKLLPEIGNLHLLWKLFAPSIIRRTKAESGENLVAKNVHRIKVNFTKVQKETYDWWIGNFSDWFQCSHQTTMADEQVRLREMILGLLWKLRLSATVPASRLLPGSPQPGMEKTFYAGKAGTSNCTEKSLFVLGKVKEVVERGEQIVIFSSLQDYQNYLFELLNHYRLKPVVVNATTPPVQRSALIAEFKKKKYNVLVAGTQAVNLGHNLDNANHIIMTDFEWDHSTTRQAIDRVHRFTSKKDVQVYLLYTDGGIDKKQLFEIIDRKGQSSDLALDGKLLDQEDIVVDFFKIAREIMAEHTMGTDGLLCESTVARQMDELMRGKREAKPPVHEPKMLPAPKRPMLQPVMYTEQLELSL